MIGWYILAQNEMTFWQSFWISLRADPRIQHWRFLFWNFLCIVFLFEDLNYKLHRPFDLWLFIHHANNIQK